MLPSQTICHRMAQTHLSRSNSSAQKQGVLVIHGPHRQKGELGALNLFYSGLLFIYSLIHIFVKNMQQKIKTHQRGPTERKEK